MISKSFVVGEIRLNIAHIIDSGGICDVGTFCTTFLATKRGIDGPDRDFYLACTYEFVREQASRVIGKWAPRPSTADQVSMKGMGFDHLQRAYPVVRGDRQMLVPIDLLSDAELEARAVDLESMAKGCKKHAKEIRSYIKKRVSVSAA